MLDRESAYELLTSRLEAQTPPAEETAAASPEAAPGAKKGAPALKEEPGIIEQVTGSPAFKSMLRSAGTVLGREITRSIFGTRKR